MSAYSFKIFLIVATLFAVGCSKSNKTTVTLAFPDWKQLQQKTHEKQSQYMTPTASATIADAGIISVNVGGKLINGFPWERKDSNPNPPASVTFDTEIGTLVQAIAILESDNGAKAYYYGDAKVTGSGTLTLDLSNVATTTNGEGKVIGRYITSVDAAGAPTGPTGVFQYRFDVAKTASGAGKPSMVVTSGETFNGWMSVTTLPSDLLIYTRADGSKIFSLKAYDDSLISATNQVLASHIHVPQGFKDEDWGATFNMRSAAEKNYVVGFFGPAADAFYTSQPLNASVCFPAVTATTWASPTPIPQLWKELAASQSPQDHPINAMWWGGDFTGVGSDAFKTAQVLAGGSKATSTTCSSGTAFVNRLSVDVSNLSSDDEFMGVRGPFARSSALGDFTHYVYSSGSQTASLDWYLLPGTQDVLDGISVFYRQTNDPNNDDDIKLIDGYDCQSMHKRQGAFADFVEKQIPVSTMSTTIGPFTQPEADKLQIVICPRGTDGVYYKSAIAVHKPQSGNTMSPATRLAARAYDGVEPTSILRSTIDHNTCTPILIEAVTANGSSGTMSSPADVTVSDMDGNAALYYDASSCAVESGGQTSLTLNAFYGRQRLWHRTDTSSGNDGVVTAIQTAGYPLAQTSFYYRIYAENYADKVLTVLQPIYYAYTCSEALVIGIDSASGAPAKIQATAGPTFVYPSLAGLTYYDTGNCVVTSSDFRFPQDNTGQSLFFKYSGNSTSIDIHPLPGESSLTAPAGQQLAQIELPGPASRIQLVNFPSNLNTTQCEPVHVELVDSNHHTAINNTGSYIYAQLSIPSGNGLFYQDPSCSGASYAAPAPMIPMGQTSFTGNYYFRTDTVGASDILVEVTSPTGFANDPALPLSISINPMTQAEHLILAGPDEYISGGNTIVDTLGSPTSTTPELRPLQMYNFRLYALTPTNVSASTFTDTVHVTITTSGVTFASTGTQQDDLNFNTGQTSFGLIFDGTTDGSTSLVQMNVAPTATAPALQPAIIGQNVPVRSLTPMRFQVYGSKSTSITSCSPMLFVYEDVNGLIRPLTSNPVVNFYFQNSVYSPVANSAMSGYGSDENCSYSLAGSGAGGVVMTPSASAGTLDYFRFGTAGSGYRIDFYSERFTWNPFSGIGAAGTGGVAGTANQMHVYGPAYSDPGVCTPYLLSEEDVSSINTTSGADHSLSITVSGSAGGSLYDTPDCLGTPNPGFTLYDSKRAFVFYWKPLNPSASATITVPTSGVLSGTTQNIYTH